jgi:hypothetical protein
MIRNTHCPYCRVELIKAENQPRSRSVEHMIPNAVLTQSRSRGEGDFYACRKCNSAKSNIDYVLAVVAKAQSGDSILAARTLCEAILRNDNTSPRFHQMMLTAEHHAHAVQAAIPIDGQDLYEYLCFLGKGQHFRSTGTIFDPRSRVIQAEFVIKPVMAALEQSYANSQGTNPFGDLASNPHAESVGGGECLIWSKGHEHLFLFHRYTAAIVRVPLRTKKSMIRAQAPGCPAEGLSGNQPALLHTNHARHSVTTSACVTMLARILCVCW